MLKKRSMLVLTLGALVAFALNAHAASSRKPTRKKTEKPAKPSIVTVKGTIAATQAPAAKGRKSRRSYYVLKATDGEYVLAGAKLSAIKEALKKSPNATFEVTGRVVKRKERQSLYAASFKVLGQEAPKEEKDEDKEGGDE